jgi:hypothetical protein
VLLGWLLLAAGWPLSPAGVPASLWPSSLGVWDAALVSSWPACGSSAEPVFSVVPVLAPASVAVEPPAGFWSVEL